MQQVKSKDLHADYCIVFESCINGNFQRHEWQPNSHHLQFQYQRRVFFTFRMQILTCIIVINSTESADRGGVDTIELRYLTWFIKIRQFIQITNLNHDT